MSYDLPFPAFYSIYNFWLKLQGQKGNSVVVSKVEHASIFFFFLLSPGKPFVISNQAASDDSDMDENLLITVFLLELSVVLADFMTDHVI